ncbi:hypothetical protein CHS0354_041956 [Potamilus streckersoni]|uniref:Exocyst complex component Sec3 PIP2-binding N-terminal domain-containing protein n=1 Tax=Potamilus streckersoni TaxID=2493646 RepID=A0AAE0T9K7_9BIVA|nr:hypothetical protein CHS0354_041956 [Potamilus streckersoni]
MTAIKHTLQKDLFQPNEERLVAFVHVTKAGKKKRSSFLCATLSVAEGMNQTMVYQVKKAEKGEVYKKKMTRYLRDLKVVDGKDARKETADFDLHFEKVYRWTASSIGERDNFIKYIWKLSQRYLDQKPEFLNVPKKLMEESKHVEKGHTSMEGMDVTGIAEDYQALTTKEEQDLDLLMSECQVAISNAEVFAEQLSKQLSVLDGANIHSIMGSEDQVLNLMRLLDDGIQQAEKIEEKLDSYNVILQVVKDQMEVMKDKDTLINISTKNHKKLLDELEHLVVSLDLDMKFQKALADGDLSSSRGILECTEAAKELEKSVSADIHPALRKMAAVDEQQKKFAKISSNFAKRLSHHLNNFFIHQGNELGETLSRHSGDLKLPQHNSIHRDLIPYAELMLWLKNADISNFNELSKVYTQSLSKLYVREVQDFFDCAKLHLAGKGDRSKLGSVGGSFTGSKLSGSSTSLNKYIEARGRSSSVQSIDSVSLSYSSNINVAARHLFDQVLEKVFSELEPVCLAEQDFCCRFFHLVSDLRKDSGQPQEVHDSDGEIWMPLNPKITVERQINEEVRNMLGALFPTLQADIDDFISFADKLDGFNSMYLLVKMSQHVINTQDAGSFLSKTFASSLVRIKRNFDSFIEMQIKAISETKVSKKSKCGIISFVHNFEDFANLAESIFKGSDRHTDLDKGYTKLVAAIFDNIERIAVDHPKTPKEVIRMENYHHMFSVLSTLKISSLEGDKKKAKHKYQDSLTFYTQDRLGRPLEKLHVFIEGVKGYLSQGVKPEDVGYQLAFSKQELRKVIKDYTGKDVKKSLEHMYKKVEKHLSEEENLLQVVWVSMQDEFIKQYNDYEELINRCYPDAKITLEFTINDVLDFFSDIARSH